MAIAYVTSVSGSQSSLLANKLSILFYSDVEELIDRVVGLVKFTNEIRQWAADQKEVGKPCTILKVSDCLIFQTNTAIISDVEIVPVPTTKVTVRKQPIMGETQGV
jgi:hypothetical protein